MVAVGKIIEAYFPKSKAIYCSNLTAETSSRDCISPSFLS